MSGHKVDKQPGRRGGDGDAAYLDKTLLHREVEVSFDDSVNGKAFLAVWLRAAAVAFAVLLLFGFAALITLVGDPRAASGSWASGCRSP